MAHENGDRFKSSNMSSGHNDSGYGTNGESGFGNHLNGHREHHGGNDEGWLSEFIGEIMRRIWGYLYPQITPRRCLQCLRSRIPQQISAKHSTHVALDRTTWT